MQPYILPYLGYMQLVARADKFVFYDDVNFIKRGWINRNQILLNGESKLFTIPLKHASQNRKICDIEIDFNSSEWRNLKLTIENAYRKAPYFIDNWDLVEALFNLNTKSISLLAAESIKLIAEYLKLKTQFIFSSADLSFTKGLYREERLIEICRFVNEDQYINSIGGTSLYNKEYFLKRGVVLFFLKPVIEPYYQHSNQFVPNLSILDVLMYCGKTETQRMVLNSELI